MSTRRSSAWGELGQIRGVVDAIASWVIGVSLLLGAIPHLGNPYFFLGSIYDYRLVNPGIGQLVAMTLPWLELIVAVCLIARLFVDSAHAVALCMFAVFASVQTAAYVRGLGISCGCFGASHETVIGWFSLSLVYGLLLLAVARNLICHLSLERSG